MFDLTITARDRQWLRESHPTLEIVTRESGNRALVGVLHFSMAFAGESEPYVLDPPPTHSGGVVINDCYQIRVELTPGEHSNLPQVYETGGRLERIAQERNLPLVDLHINPGGAACLCIKPEESEKLPKGYTMKDFFNLLVIPFFYAQSYYEKNSDWPWGQYSHGALGFIEWYLRQRDIDRQAVKKL